MCDYNDDHYHNYNIIIVNYISCKDISATKFTKIDLYISSTNSSFMIWEKRHIYVWSRFNVLLVDVFVFQRTSKIPGPIIIEIKWGVYIILKWKP